MDRFVVSKDKRFAFPNGAPGGSSKLVAMERSDLRSVKEIAGVQTFIAQKPIDVAVNTIVARFQDCVDDAAGGPPVLRRIAGRQDRKLLDRIDAQLRPLHAAG